MVEVNDTEREALVSKPNTAVLGTLWTKGRVHQAPVWYFYKGGVFEIITGRGSQKHRNVLRSGRASLCIDERDGRFRSVTAEGPVQVRDVVTKDERYRLYLRYRGEEEARQITASDEESQMVMLVLTPERWFTFG
jgi:PPOX class probable F420-dependent enzyme